MQLMIVEGIGLLISVVLITLRLTYLISLLLDQMMPECLHREKRIQRGVGLLLRSMRDSVRRLKHRRV